MCTHSIHPPRFQYPLRPSVRPQVPPSKCTSNVPTGAKRGGGNERRYGKRSRRWFSYQRRGGGGGGWGCARVTSARSGGRQGELRSGGRKMRSLGTRLSATFSRSEASPASRPSDISRARPTRLSAAAAAGIPTHSPCQRRRQRPCPFCAAPPDASVWWPPPMAVCSVRWPFVPHSCVSSPPSGCASRMRFCRLGMGRWSVPVGGGGVRVYPCMYGSGGTGGAGSE